MQLANFKRNQSTLIIEGDLTWPLDMRFDMEISALLADVHEAGLNDITIDLRAVVAISSQYIGALAAVAAELKKVGGSLSVMASNKIAQILRNTGLDRLVALYLE